MADCPQRLHRKCRKRVGSVAASRLHGERKPFEQALLEFLWSGADGAAMVGVGNFPENDAGINVMDLTGVTNWNIAINLTMNEEDWHTGRGDGILRRRLIHVEMVFPADVEESEFDDWAEESAPEPGAEMQGLAQAVVSDFMKTRKRRFRGDGAEAGFYGERLQELAGSHGFGKSEDAMRMILSREKVKPLANVVAFKKAVGCERASAGAVSAGVGKKNGETVSKE